MKNPLVSVIVVVKNGEKFIAEALQSIVNNTYQNKEIIVIDGNSTDRTLEIVKKFENVSVINQPNIGIANAYNFGIEKCRGQLICFLSHDDIWDTYKIELQVNEFESDSSLEYCITEVQYFVEPNTKIPPGFRSELLNKNIKGFMMEALMVKREIYEKIGFYNSDLPVSEDTDWFARCIDANLNYRCINQPLVRKRIHGDNAHLNQDGIQKIILKAMYISIKRKRQVE